MRTNEASRATLRSTLEVLGAVEQMAAGAKSIVDSTTLSNSSARPPTSTMEQFNLGRPRRRLETQLRELVGEMRALWSDLIQSRFPNQFLPAIDITPEMREEARSAQPGDVAYMVVAARTVGGFYSVLASLETALANLLNAVREGRENHFALREQAERLHAFALGAYQFYDTQRKVA